MNTGRAHKQTQAAHPLMPPCCNYRYILVMVGRFRKWVEAYPCRKGDAVTVVKLLMKEYICRYGIPCGISSNQGGSFIAHITKEMCNALQIKQSFHCPYHPQSVGDVERQNGTLNNKLGKICDEPGLKWPKALPLVLMDMRSTVNRMMGLSPHKILMGRPMRVQVTAPIDLNQLQLQQMEGVKP